MTYSLKSIALVGLLASAAPVAALAQDSNAAAGVSTDMGGSASVAAQGAGTDVGANVDTGASADAGTTSGMGQGEDRKSVV